MEKGRIYTIIGIIVVVVCSICIYNNIMYEMSISQDYRLNMRYYKALRTCHPVKIKIKDENSTKEILGKADFSCSVNEDGKKCNFPISILPKLSSTGIKFLEAAESGDISEAEAFDEDMVWLQDMYTKYCK